MSLLGLIFTLVIVGFVLWLLTSFVPMEPRIKQIIIGVVILLVILWLLGQLGFIDAFDRPLYLHRR